MKNTEINKVEFNYKLKEYCNHIDQRNAVIKTHNDELKELDKENTERYRLYKENRLLKESNRQTSLKIEELLKGNFPHIKFSKMLDLREGYIGNDIWIPYTKYVQKTGIEFDCKNWEEID